MSDWKIIVVDDELGKRCGKYLLRKARLRKYPLWRAKKGYLGKGEIVAPKGIPPAWLASAYADKGGNVDRTARLILRDWQLGEIE